MKWILGAVAAGVVAAAAYLAITNQTHITVLPSGTYTVPSRTVTPQPGRWQLPVGVVPVHKASPIRAHLLPVTLPTPTPVPTDFPAG